jgi:hypothetical protein
MRTLLGMTGAAALALAACGGNVVVDTASSTGGTTTTTTPTTTNITTITTISTTVPGCSPTCSAAITTGGAAPCGGTGLAAYQALQSCSCVSGSVCAASCGANFCLHATLSVPCAQCLTASCGGNYQICTTN